jgi:MATE family multidrug resistance protein
MDAAPVSIDAGRHPAGSLRELLAIAIPLVISSGSLSLMHVMDRMMMTWYSEDALAASTPGGMLHWTLMSLPFGMVMYVNTFIAQYDGAGRRERVAASTWQGVWLAAAAGIVLALATPFTARLTALFGHGDAVQALESDYFSVLSWGTPPAMISAALSTFFSGRGRTTVLMIVNLFVAVSDGFVSWWLIFGSGPFPELGIVGAALGSVFGQVVGCAMYLGFMFYGADARSYPFREQCRVDTTLLSRMTRYGLPNGVQFTVDIAAYLLLLVFIGRIGNRELAATNLAFNLNSLAFIPMFGMGTAVSVLVGRRIGENRADIAIRTTWLAFGMAAIYNAVWALIYLFAQDAILAPYARFSDPAAFAELRPMVQTLLVYVVLYMYFDAMAVIFGSATRGAGDTQFSLYYTGIVLWTTMVLPVWLIQRSGGGLYACWGVMIVQLCIMGCGFLARFLQGKWLTMRVIEPSLLDAPAAEMGVAAAIEEPGMVAPVGTVGVRDVMAESMVLEDSAAERLRELSPQ